MFDTAYAKVGVYICYDRHFPEGWRALALNGAEYIVNPSATVAGLSKYLWELEQPASAAANGVFIGAINRIGTEEPWATSHNMGEFYGSSYIVNPRGEIEAQASYGDDELLVHAPWRPRSAAKRCACRRWYSVLRPDAPIRTAEPPCPPSPPDGPP